MCAVEGVWHGQSALKQNVAEEAVIFVEEINWNIRGQCLVQLKKGFKNPIKLKEEKFWFQMVYVSMEMYNSGILKEKNDTNF